jgi:hypothetical protein
MDWQTAGVVGIVSGAVWFLAQRMLLIRRRRKRPAQTFVPLSSLRKPADRPPGDGPACH